MNTKFKIALKFLSLYIFLFYFSFGIYAHTKCSNTSSINTNIRKLAPNENLANLDSDEFVRKYQSIEDWMLKIEIKKVNHEDQKQLEEWMFDEYFWKIEKPAWDETPTEDPREIESWMMNIDIQKFGCINIYSDFKEKEWMKVHTFFIL